MKLRAVILVSLVLTMLLVSAALVSAQAPQGREPTAKVEAALASALQAEGSVPTLVFLASSADTSAARSLPTKAEKTRYVYETLRDHARRSQADLRAYLDARGVAYQSFYLVNMLALPAADATLINALAARDDVATLALDQTYDVSLPRSEPVAAAAAPTTVTLSSGVSFIQADKVWSQHNITGRGIVVAGADTGVRWTHAALKSRYRGWNSAMNTADHDYNWHDSIHSIALFCPGDSPEPCDDHDHGTHTIGTVLGSEGTTNQIGVAPGATWIACRNMIYGVGLAYTGYVECNEFFLAPYPVGGDPQTEGDPSKAPDVINNSWGCVEGCTIATWQSLEQQMVNFRNAGILFVASAGNDGDAQCNSMLNPPAASLLSFAVGASDDNNGTIAGFSSRGRRSPQYNDPTKYPLGAPGPDIAAPGVNIRSAVSSGDAAYAESGWSGTSMAGPHAAGTAALIWEAYPALKGHLEETEQYIRETTTWMPDTTCGTWTDPEYPSVPDARVPNNVYGYGNLNALAVVKAVLNPNDTDYDGDIDVRDIQRVAAIWNTSLGQADYNARLNLDFTQGTADTIDLYDVVAVALAWQE